MYYNPDDDQYHNPAAELLLTGSTGHFHWSLKCSQDFLYRIMLKIKPAIFSTDASDFSLLFCGLLL